MVLKELFEEMWGRVRQTSLCAGQPQSALCRESLSTARQALSIATEAQDNQLLIEAWCMMAYALNVNDRYVDALPYYRQAIRALLALPTDTRRHTEGQDSSHAQS